MAPRFRTAAASQGEWSVCAVTFSRAMLTSVPHGNHRYTGYRRQESIDFGLGHGVGFGASSPLRKAISACGPRMQHAFKEIDKNEDGSLSRKEIHKYLRENIPEFLHASRAEEFKKLMDDMDVNHDGSVSFKEWKEFLAKPEFKMGSQHEALYPESLTPRGPSQSRIPNYAVHDMDSPRSETSSRAGTPRGNASAFGQPSGRQTSEKISMRPMTASSSRPLSAHPSARQPAASNSFMSARSQASLSSVSGSFRSNSSFMKPTASRANFISADRQTRIDKAKDHAIASRMGNPMVRSGSGFARNNKNGTRCW